MRWSDDHHHGKWSNSSKKDFSSNRETTRQDKQEEPEKLSVRVKNLVSTFVTSLNPFSKKDQ
jgi:hypothetical protein